MADRLEIFDRLLAQVRPSSEGRPHLVDLGTGHGKFARVALDAGWAVTAVDGRPDRFPDVPEVDWVVADVRGYEIPRDADCIAVLGLLYHLELDSQLDLLNRCAGTPTIVDTHVASRVTHTAGRYDGYQFWEDRTAPTASLDNEYSFWPTRESLHQMFVDCGFETILELVPWYRDDRTFWLCL